MHTEQINIPAYGHIDGCRVTATWAPSDLHCFCILKMEKSQPVISDVSLAIFIEIRDRFQKQRNKSKQLRIIFSEQQGCWELVPIWTGSTLTALERHSIPNGFFIHLG